jgi:DnaJ-class molecular chaperone with C-terminal Zn finger domain
MKSHYETLGVSPDATKDEIKRTYRRLVLQYHPDTSKTKSKADENKFKQISAAYAVLSDDKARKRFDLELEEFKRYGKIRRGGGSAGTGPFGQRQSTGMAYRFHVLDGIYKPKNMLIGLTLGFATVATIKSLLGIEEEKTVMQRNLKEDGKAKLVEAWYNKHKKQWEQPAPWSKHFREQNPEIHLVPREKVRPFSE